MKHLTQLCILLGFTVACTPENSGNKETENSSDEINVSLTQMWSTDTTALKTPESVLYDSNNDILYVSCINGVPPDEADKDGYIAKISPEDGSIIEEQWVTDLSAPKGMGLYEGKLYVSDINQLVVIDVASGEVDNKYDIQDASFLNDITIDHQGVVYISDSNKNRIYKLEDGEVTTWTEDEDLGGPNGLFHDGEKMMVATFEKGDFNEIDYANREVKPVVDSIPGGDGVVKVGVDFIVSNWNGEVYYVTSGFKKKKILDTKDAGANAADIEFIQEDNLLLVPTFFGNSVVAYKVSQE